MFRGKMLALLKAAHAQGRLQFFGPHTALADKAAFKTFLEPLYHTHWHVYAKPPFAGPQQVLAYLARYTHRVAISQQPADQRRRDWRHVPLQGLSDQRACPQQDHDAGARRVHPPLHASCIAQGLSPHPPLRPAGALPRQGRDAGTRPRVDCCHNTSGEDAVQRASCRNERATGASLSVLWCSHGNHRDLRGGLYAAPSTHHHASRDQDRHVMIRSPPSRSSPPINCPAGLLQPMITHGLKLLQLPPHDHSFAHESPAQRLLVAIICQFGPPRHYARGSHQRPLHPSLPAKSP